MLNFSGKVPANLGIHKGQFLGQRTKPNFVSSQSNDPQHSIDPIPFSGDLATCKFRMKGILQDLAACQIVKNEELYIHAEFRSNFFGFVDDLELYFDQEKEVIEVRSCARLGYKDFNVNRTRVDKIRGLLANQT